MCLLYIHESCAQEKPGLNLKFYCFCSVQTRRSGWTQLAKIKLPVAIALPYFSSAPEPAFPTLYNRSVCLHEGDRAKGKIVKS